MLRTLRNLAITIGVLAPIFAALWVVVEEQYYLPLNERLYRAGVIHSAPLGNLRISMKSGWCPLWSKSAVAAGKRPNVNFGKVTGLSNDFQSHVGFYLDELQMGAWLIRESRTYPWGKVDILKSDELLSSGAQFAWVRAHNLFIAMDAEQDVDEVLEGIESIKNLEPAASAP